MRMMPLRRRSERTPERARSERETRRVVAMMKTVRVVILINMALVDSMTMRKLAMMNNWMT